MRTRQIPFSQKGNQMKKLFCILSCSVFCTVSGIAAVIPITSFNSPYTQNFDVLASSGTSSVVPDGWAFREVGSSDSLYRADDGGASYSDTFSYGTTGSSERAWGSIYGSVVTSIGAGFRNDTGRPITTLAISYIGEQWRLGQSGRADSLTCLYSLNATSLADGTWTPVPALTFKSPNISTSVGPLNGNDSLNRRLISAELSGLSFDSGSTIWLRFRDDQASGPNDGLAVDDFSLTAIPEPVNFALGVFGGIAVAAGILRNNWKGNKSLKSRHAFGQCRET